MGRADSVNWTFTQLDVPGAIGTVATGINNAGQIVGYYTTPSFHGFLYAAGAFTTIDVPPRAPGFEAVDTFPSGINSSGQIVGTFETGDHIQHGFELDARGITVLDPPGSVSSVAGGINDSGQIVGYFYTSGGEHGFLNTNGILTIIDVPGLPTQPRGLNNGGQIVGSTSSYEGFLYTNGAYTSVHFPGVRNSVPMGINDAGQIVELAGGVLDAGGEFTPILIPGSQLSASFGINNAGQVAGEFIDSSGRLHGFVATPVPEPASTLLLALGVLVACTFSKSRAAAFACPRRKNAAFGRASAPSALVPWQAAPAPGPAPRASG